MNQIEKDFFGLLDMTHKVRDDAPAALSDENLSGKIVDRGGGSMPVLANFHTYREAVLIIFGKLDCYLKALAKHLPNE